VNRIGPPLLLTMMLALPAVAQAKRAPRNMGLEIGLRGGWMAQLNQPVADAIMDRGRIKADASLGVDLEAGATLGDRLSLILRFGYKQRLEEWESAYPDDMDALKLTYSLIHLPAFNVKYRPFFRQFSVYVTAGGGVDLLVYAPSVGVAYATRSIRLPGAGLNAGGGLELFLNPRFGFVFDVRYHLSIHGTEGLVFEDRDTGTVWYDLSFKPLHHNLTLYLGIEARM
jgi:hypothetical protein